MDTETREQAVSDLFEFAVNLAKLASGGITVSLHGVPFGQFNSAAFDEVEVQTRESNGNAYLTATKKFTLGLRVDAFSPDIVESERGRDLLAATVGAVDAQGEVALRAVR